MPVGICRVLRHLHRYRLGYHVHVISMDSTKKKVFTGLYWFSLVFAIYDLILVAVSVVSHRYGHALWNLAMFGIQFGVCFYCYTTLNKDKEKP